MLKLVVLLVCFAAIGLAKNFPVTELIGKPRADNVDYKLPGNVSPTEYDITLTPDFAKNTFSGKVTIDVKIVEETNTIILHGNKIEIDKDKITVIGTGDDIFKSISEDTTRHFHTIELLELVKAEATLKITIEYTGTLNTKDHEGFYIAKYTDEKGDEKVFATTQFEATSAREAFPCFDQPDMKALFTIHIIRPTDYTSISNMPLASTKDLKDGTSQDDFKKTNVVMSTYLVAFAVFQLDHEPEDAKADYKVYGIPHLIKDGRGKYAVDNAPKVIDAMEKFVGGFKYLDYMDKMDQVAIPDDYFAAGAMENWGLVTYKQRYLLKKDGLTTASEKQNILSIIAHEFAHQWFGNLVSPKWWDCLWLNEGFATYFEHYATDVVDSDMKMMDQFLILSNQVAMESDASDETRAMTSDVGSPEEISNNFDRIAYQKSGAVIRMMEHILTTDVFKTGLYHYLKNMEKKSAVPSDLWEAMQNAIEEITDDDKKPMLDDKTVSAIMDTWSTQTGYPVVQVKRDTDGTITLSQDRFLFSKATSGENTVWNVPINYASEDDPTFTDTATQFWLTTKETKTSFKVDTTKWVILNKQGIGFYRVNYDEDTWQLIIKYLNSDNYNKINFLNRAQLIDDSFNLARAGRIKYTIPLTLSQYLIKEEDYIPLYTFLKSIQFLNNHLAASDNYEYLKAYVNETLNTALQKLGTDDKDGHLNKFNRNNVISWLCRFEHETCTKAMHDKLENLEDGTVIPADLQNAVYCGGMRKSDSGENKFKKLYGLYTSSDKEYLEKARILAGMGCSLDKAILTKMLKAAMGEDTDYKAIADGDKVGAFTAVYTSSDVGLDTALNFVVDNIAKIRTVFDKVQLSTIFNGIASRTSSQAHLDKLSGLTSTTKDIADDEFKKILEKAQKTIETNVKWANTNLADVNAWLEETYGSAGFITVSVSLVLSMLVVLNLL